MKIIARYLVITVFLFACKGKKQVASSPQSNGKAAILESKKLKSAFIDAKKEAIIGNTENAKALFKKILDADQKCTACAYELATIAIQQKDAVNAEKMSAFAYKNDPSNLDYKRQRAEVVYMLGDPKRAAKLSRSLIDSFPKTRDHYKRTIFYYEKSGMYDEAENVLHSYRNQFGFNRRTAMMYDYLYKSSNNNAKIEKNWAELSRKYPSEIQYKTRYINTLIENKKIEMARNEINSVEKNMQQPGQANLLRARLAAKEGKWSDYVRLLKMANQDKSVDGSTQLTFLVKAKEVKDSSILSVIRSIGTNEPKALDYLHFYEDLFGKKSNALSRLEQQYKSNPNNTDVAKKLIAAYSNSYEWEKINSISETLIEFNPTHVEFYALHAKNLLALGKFGDAYAYADQGLTYAIDKDEICQMHTLQAFANHYLGKKENIKKDLEKAWANIGANEAIKAELIYVSMVNDLFGEKIQNTLGGLTSSYIKTLHALYMADNYEKEAWKTFSLSKPNNQIIIEAWLLKARAKNENVDFSILKNMQMRKFPLHEFYKTISIQ